MSTAVELKQHLDTIGVDPAQIEPWLVFADWLDEEYGDSELAAAIRKDIATISKKDAVFESYNVICQRMQLCGADYDNSHEIKRARSLGGCIYNLIYELSRLEYLFRVTGSTGMEQTCHAS